MSTILTVLEITSDDLLTTHNIVKRLFPVNDNRLEIGNIIEYPPHLFFIHYNDAGEIDSTLTNKDSCIYWELQDLDISPERYEELMEQGYSPANTAFEVLESLRRQTDRCPTNEEKLVYMRLYNHLLLVLLSESNQLFKQTTGYASEGDWMIEHVGTAHIYQGSIALETDGKATIKIESLDKTPMWFFSRLASEFPMCNFKVTWLDEDKSHLCGSVVLVDNDVIKIPESFKVIEQRVRKWFD